ncbi:tetratricopeptide repeat protein [Desulfococcaceae bacterium HSG7]|nr:tetratricopeptide repeat protein [Desulfococcaceae bacterium HSG7]
MKYEYTDNPKNSNSDNGIKGTTKMKKGKQRVQLSAYNLIWVFGVIVIISGAFIACSSHSGPYGKIIDDSEKAIAKNPKDTQAYMQLGKSYMQLGKYHKALETFLTRSQIPPDDINTEYYIGVCYEELGFFSKALAQYQKIALTDKKLADKLLNLITR